MRNEPTAIFQNYIWKKSWARQYESPFSLFLNFCKINVLTFPQTCKILGLTNNPDKNGIARRGAFFCEEIGIEIAIAGIKSVAPIKDMLGLNDTPFFTDQTLSSNAYTNLIDNNFKYCSECLMRAGYHSYFHQIRGVSHCFIHHTGLVITNIDYAISLNPLRVDFPQKTELGLPGSFTDEIPLPGYRIELNIPKFASNFPNPVKKIFVSSNSPYLESDTLGTLLTPESQHIKPVIILKDVNKKQKVFKTLHNIMIDAACQGQDEEFKLYYGRVQTKKERELIFNSIPYIRDYNPSVAMLYKKIQDLTDKYHVCDDNGDIKHLEYMDHDIISVKQIGVLLLHFIRMIVGVFDVDTALSIYWIEHPNGGLCFDPFHLYEYHLHSLFNDSDPQMQYDDNKNHTERRWRYRRIDTINIALINDAVEFLWKQCLEKTKHWKQETINIMEFLTDLYVPHYLIVWMNNEEVWIYRTVAIPKRKTDISADAF